MKPNAKASAAVGLLAGFTLSACLGAMANDPKTSVDSSHDHSTMAGHHQASMEMHRIMQRGGTMPMPMSGDVDKDFATMMSAHHQQAIDMVDILLQHGDDEKLKAMARKMKAAQQREIQELAPFTR